MLDTCRTYVFAFTHTNEPMVTIIGRGWPLQLIKHISLTEQNKGEFTTLLQACVPREQTNYYSLGEYIYETTIPWRNTFGKRYALNSMLDNLLTLSL